MGDIDENEDTQLQTRENDEDIERPLWRKFRPKLWFSSIWKKYSVESRLDSFKTFLKINIIPASISVTMGLCYLILKTRGPKCKVAPYSDLLNGLRDGSVTRVQFKENSRRIMYNSKPQGSGSAKVLKNNNPMFKIQEAVKSLLKEMSKKHEFLPEPHRSRLDADETRNGLVANQVSSRGWQFLTRYIDDDCRELLVLALSSSIFIGSSFIIKKKGLMKAGATGIRAGQAVSKFCAKYLHKQVLKHEAYAAGDIGTAFQKSFLRSGSL